jgi:endoglucanase
MSNADGAELVQYTCGSGTNQQFQMVANGSYFQLRARHSGKCTTNTNQQWSRTQV